MSDESDAMDDNWEAEVYTGLRRKCAEVKDLVALQKRQSEEHEKAQLRKLIEKHGVPKK